MNKYEKVFEEDEYYYSTRYNNTGAGEIMGGVLGLVFGLALKVGYYLLLYAPILAIAYWVMHSLEGTLGSLQTKGLVFIGVAYALFCLIYFLKGLTIAFRKSGHWVWVPLLVACVAITCLLPTVFVGVIAFDFLKSLSGTHPFVQQLGSWCIGALAGWFIYCQYEFTRDDTPLLTYWAYILGFKLRLFFQHL